MPTSPFQPRRLAVIGGSNMDLSGRPQDRLVLGESNIGQIQATPGGVGRNMAEALARLGHQVWLISALGDDAMAAVLRAESEAAGVDLSACLCVPGAASSTYLTLLDQSGELLAAINDMGLIEALDPSALRARRQTLAACEAWVVDANLSPASLAALFELAAEGGTDPRPIFAEPVSASKALRLRPYLDQLSLLKPNRAEAAALTGLAADAPACDLARALHDLGLQRLVLSLGRDGLYASAVGAPAVTLAAPDTAVQSVTGAGDTLMAGLIDALLAEQGLLDALRWAQAAALLSLQSDRAISPAINRQALTTMIKDQPL
jgi:pseudouridine kinase